MPDTLHFSDEQSRTIINLEQRYQVWMEAGQNLTRLPYDLRRKEVKGHDYLYEIFDRNGNGRSLGRFEGANEEKFTTYRVEKEALKQRIQTSRQLLEESCALYRALRLPVLSSEAGAILREADRRSLLGSHLMVVGTNVLPAYAIEANAFIQNAPDETEDFDLAWTASDQPEDGEHPLWDMLKSVDSTFTMNLEREFQARNAKAYEVELLVSPSKAGTLGRFDKPKPIPLPEQEWLLLGRPVDHVTVCRDGSPARLFVPDPRYFALHKLWMSAQSKRNPLKRPKDEKQGNAILNTVQKNMPHYSLDTSFARELPESLIPFFRQWKERERPAGYPTETW